MKVRKGFVSNSSSSSFVVISNQGPSVTLNLPAVLKVDSKLGNTQFGWEFHKYNDFGSKLIFAYMQAIYAKNNDWLTMLERVVVGSTAVKEIEWEIALEDYNDPNLAYIDHASTAGEDRTMGKMFDCEKMLFDFLFLEKSYIQTGNDNSEAPSWWL